MLQVAARVLRMSGPRRERSTAELIAEAGTRVRFTAGQALFREGDRSDAVYACLSGRVRLFATTPTGRDVVFGERGPGQFFGELSAIDRRPRSASATAVEPTVVAVLGAQAFLAALDIEPRLALPILRELSDQLRRSNAAIAARDSENVRTRVGGVLLELARQHQRHARAELITLTLSQDDLAAWVGSTREAAARALAVLRRGGIVETGRGRIVVRDIDGLARACGAA